MFFSNDTMLLPSPSPFLRFYFRGRPIRDKKFLFVIPCRGQRQVSAEWQWLLPPKIFARRFVAKKYSLPVLYAGVVLYRISSLKFSVFK
jgi:hypothetical protein